MSRQLLLNNLPAAILPFGARNREILKNCGTIEGFGRLEIDGRIDPHTSLEHGPPQHHETDLPRLARIRRRSRRRRAASPAIRGMKPVGGQRGTEVVVTLTGQRLADAQGDPLLSAGDHGHEARGGPRTARSTATFKIAADAPLGLHDLRLRTATGVSALRTFSVGALKEVAEVEPNNDFAKPQPIAMNVTVNGVADNEDVDYYAVEAKKGERITAEVEGIRLGLTLFDPYVAILDAKRFELASSDDAALIWQDGFVSVVAPEDGTYIVQARESAYAGNGELPLPAPRRQLPPADGDRPRRRQARRDGDGPLDRRRPGREDDQPDPARRASSATSAWSPRTSAGPPPIRTLPPLPVRQRDRGRAERHHATATPFSPAVALNGVIGTRGRRRPLRLQGEEGPDLRRPVFARQLRSPLDSVLSIVAKNGGQIAGNDDSGGPDSYLRFNAPKDGEYVVSVGRPPQEGRADYAYRVEVSPVDAEADLSTPERVAPPRHRDDGRGRPAGEPPGDPDQRRPRRLRRRPDPRPPRTCPPG